MKKFGILPLIVVATALMSFCRCYGAPEVPKNDISVSDVKGTVTHDAGKGPKAVGIMETIPEDTVLKIDKSASISLCRPGYKTLPLTSADSPYTVGAHKFERDSSIWGKTAEHMANAFKYYIHPDTNPTLLARTYTRGEAAEEDQCRDNIWPLHKADILYRSDEPLTLKWGLDGRDFSLVILEHFKGISVLQKNVSGNAIDIPMSALKPGKKYTWGVTETGTGKKCSAVFAILGKEESAEIFENLNTLTAHLPAEAGSETRYRMLAGYLASELLVYDAWKLLDQNHIKP